MEPAEVLTLDTLSIDPVGSVAVAARKLSGRGVSAAPAIGAEGRPHGMVGEGDLLRPPVKPGLRLSAKGSAAPPWSCACTQSISAALALHATQTGVVRAWLRGPDGRTLANEGTKVAHAFLASVAAAAPGMKGGAR